MSSQKRSPLVSSTTTTPAVETSQAAPSSQRAGNAAARARAGLSGTTPSTIAALPSAGECLDLASAGLETVIAGLGEMAAVVLDAMPLPQAVRLAWGRRDEGWARAWIEGHPAAEIVRAAPELVRAGFDLAWPVGLGVAVGGMLGGGFGIAAAELTEEALAERAADGIRVRLHMTGKGALAAGLGAKLTGAGDAAMLGGDAEAKLAAAPAVTAEWRIDDAAVLDALLVGAPAAIGALLTGRASAASLASAALADLLGCVEPCSVHIANDGEIDVGAEGAAGAIAGIGAKGHAEAGGAVGSEDGRVYVEAHLGGSATGEWATWFWAAMRAFGVFPSTLGGTAGIDATVRASGTPEAITALREGAPGQGITYEATVTRAVGDTTTAETFATTDPATFAAWLQSVVDPVDTLLGEGAAPVPAAELPDVALTRGVERAVGDIGELDAAVPGVAARVRGMAAAVVEPLDDASDRALVDLDVDATLTGSVRVPVEAVRAALGGAALSPGPEGIETRVLDVARVVAKEVIGGSAPAADLPALDLEAAAPLVERDDVELLVKAEARAGVGGGVAAGLLTSAKVDAGIAFTWRERLAVLPRAEQARLLGV